MIAVRVGFKPTSVTTTLESGRAAAATIQNAAEEMSPGRSEERRVGKEGDLRCVCAQAEDGIRDYKVTGVQTCALPILPDWFGIRTRTLMNVDLRTHSPQHVDDRRARGIQADICDHDSGVGEGRGRHHPERGGGDVAWKIGRASCRERG